MGMFDWLRSLSGPTIRRFDEDRRLHGGDEAALARDVALLVPGARGWIALAEAARLFSSTPDARYAFGQADEHGRQRLEEFAASHRLQLDLMPDGRVYFTRLP
jgi:hypothetical protein